MSIFDLSMCDAKASEQRSYRDIDPGGSSGNRWVLRTALKKKAAVRAALQVFGRSG
jgi:hypothetical protein